MSSNLRFARRMPTRAIWMRRALTRARLTANTSLRGWEGRGGAAALGRGMDAQSWLKCRLAWNAHERERAHKPSASAQRRGACSGAEL